jgi:hypothetical protein
MPGGKPARAPWRQIMIRIRLRGKGSAAQAELYADGTSPPIVVRRGRQGDVACWRRAETEIAPVLALMKQIGLTGAGFKIAGGWETGINTEAAINGRGSLELLLAREAIREQARGNGTFWALPHAVCTTTGSWRSCSATAAPGKPWEPTMQRPGRSPSFASRPPGGGSASPGSG